MTMVHNIASTISSIAKEVSQLLDGLDIRCQQQVVRREGALVGVQVISEPQERDTFHLSVRVFPRQPEIQMSEEDITESLSACQEALHDANWHIRVSALHTLSQLGGKAAVVLVRQAQHDAEPYVRQAAQQALTQIELPRLATELLTGGCLVLYRHEGSLTYVWHQTTNTRGHAWFADLPGTGSYRLRWREHACPPTPVPLPRRQAALAAAAALAADKALTFPTVVPSTDDVLVCTVRVVAAENVVELAFESQQEALNETWVRFDLVDQDAGYVVHSGLVLLHAVASVYEGRYYLHDIRFDAPCTLAFGSIDPVTLTTDEAPLVTAAYQATDTRNRMAWRAWLQQQEATLRAHPAWRAVYGMLAEA